MKNLLKCIILITPILIIINSCDQKKQPLSKAEMMKIVEERNEKLAECFKESNADKLAEMYTDSAKLCPNGNNFVVGNSNIKAFWTEDFKTSKVLEMNTNVMTIDGNDEVIYETGKTTSRILYEDSVYVPTVKYINVWKKQPDGTYKLDVDFWNKDGQ
jgi:ketosteroid isomerase-like protein